MNDYGRDLIYRTLKGVRRTSKMNILFCLSTFLLLLVVGTKGQQRVAPGVPPQQYTGQVQQHQMGVPQHQVPVQHQVPGQHQAPVQHQVPVQQIQQQIPVQQQQHQQQQMHQQMPQQVHPGHQAPPQGQILSAANIAHEKQHIQEHMEVPIDTSKMSEQELQFHYFKMHDADNNNKLDGCELIKSLIHWHATNTPTDKMEQQAVYSDEEIANMVDDIMKDSDLNNDGFIDYAEYKQSENK
ncbi:lymphotoxin beta receptor inhibitor isoform X2 [Periplaneta americana]|uniref:lymphotoxin beta receptor inhibitor isoform X2 n=1 Tax=Periplaneta americana TaxID=6978 RepID=UPI0037E92393